MAEDQPQQGTIDEPSTPPATTISIIVKTAKDKETVEIEENATVEEVIILHVYFIQRVIS